MNQGVAMLIHFESEVGNLTMFGDVAVKLLKMMGHSGAVPSAILPKDIPAALSRLQSALQVAEPASASRTGGKTEREGEREPPVSLRRRAHPLIELLTRAAERDTEVIWR
jgi:hypothetical protein